MTSRESMLTALREHQKLVSDFLARSPAGCSWDQGFSKIIQEQSSNLVKINEEFVNAAGLTKEITDTWVRFEKLPGAFMQEAYVNRIASILEKRIADLEKQS